MVTIIEITQTNAVIMEDLAYRHVFGCAIENNERGVLRALISEIFHSGEATAKNLTAGVAIQLNVSRPTATKLIKRTCDLSYINCKVDVNNERRKLYNIPQDVRVKLKAVGVLQSKIGKVVEAQLANPKDDHAGEELLDAPIYFNIAIPEYKKMYRARIEEKKREMYDDTNRGDLENAA